MIQAKKFFDAFFSKDIHDFQYKLSFFIFESLKSRAQYEDEANMDVVGKEKRKPLAEYTELIDNLIFLQDKIMHQYEAVRTTLMCSITDVDASPENYLEAFTTFSDLLRLMDCLDMGIRRLRLGNSYNDDGLNSWIKEMRELVGHLSLT